MFSIQSRTEGGCLIMVVNGELTHQQCGRFFNKLKHEVTPSIRRVILDVAGLTFMTASALAEIAQLHMLLAENGSSLVLAGPSPQVRRMLLLGFLDKVIPMTLTVDDALGSREPPASRKRGSEA